MTKEVGEVEVILTRADVARILALPAGSVSETGELALRLALRKADGEVLSTLES